MSRPYVFSFIIIIITIIIIIIIIIIEVEVRKAAGLWAARTTQEVDCDL